MCCRRHQLKWFSIFPSFDTKSERHKEILCVSTSCQYKNEILCSLHFQEYLHHFIKRLQWTLFCFLFFRQALLPSIYYLSFFFKRNIFLSLFASIIFTNTFVIYFPASPNDTEAVDLLQQLGADHVIFEDDLAAPETRALIQELHPRVAFNCIGGRPLTNLCKALPHGTHVITYGGMSKKPINLPTVRQILQYFCLIFRNISLLQYLDLRVPFLSTAGRSFSKVDFFIFIFHSPNVV